MRLGPRPGYARYLHYGTRLLAVGAMAFLVSCGGGHETQGPTVADWVTGGGQEAIDGLSEAMSAITASTQGVGSPLLVSCAQLSDAVDEARTAGPLPGPGGDDWDAALTLFGEAADACRAGDLAVVGPKLTDAARRLDGATASF